MIESLRRAQRCFAVIEKAGMEEVAGEERELDKLALKCHRLTKMFMWGQCCNYKGEPCLNANGKFSERVDWDGWRGWFFGAIPRAIQSFLLVAFYQLLEEPLSKEQRRALSEFIEGMHSEGIALPESIGRYPPNIQEFLDAKSHLLSFPTVKALLLALGLPSTYPELHDTLFTRQSAILASTSHSTADICGIRLSASYADALHSLHTRHALSISGMNRDWLFEHCPMTLRSDSLGRRLLRFNLLCRLFAQTGMVCVPEKKRHAGLIPTGFSLAECSRWFCTGLKFSAPLHALHGDSFLQHEAEVEPWITISFHRWTQFDVALAYCLHMRSREALQRLKGADLIALYIKPQPNATDDEDSGNGVQFAALCLSVALQGVNVLAAGLHLIDLYTLLWDSSGTDGRVAGPLLIALGLAKTGSQDTAFAKLASLHVNPRWSCVDDFSLDDPKAPASWTHPQHPDLPLETQVGALLALGLCYCQSRDERWSRRLHREAFERQGMACWFATGGIRQSHLPCSLIRKAFDDGYRMASAIAFGLVNLGSGSDILLAEITHTSPRIDQGGSQFRASFWNSARLMALSLSFFQSGRNPLILSGEKFDEGACPWHSRMLLQLTALVTSWPAEIDYGWFVQLPAPRRIAVLLYSGLAELSDPHYQMLMQHLHRNLLPKLTQVPAENACFAERFELLWLGRELGAALLCFAMAKPAESFATVWRLLTFCSESIAVGPLSLDDPLRMRLLGQAWALLTRPLGLRCSLPQKALLFCAIWPEDDADEEVSWYPRVMRYFWLLSALSPDHEERAAMQAAPSTKLAECFAIRQSISSCIHSEI